MIRRRVQLFLPLIICVVALPLCALWVHPSVEMGIIDDWSYARTAQILAETGRIVYNGWATAMVGWQLFFGAALIKVFGFSFTVTRVGTLLIAMATAALMQRTLVRLGITEWNSAAATLVMVLSPVFMAVTFSFMSDIYGMLVLVGCSYLCVRSLQASSERRAAAWICAAALGSAVGGTARQIAWVALVAMVPSALWLLRKSRSVLWLGTLCTVAGGILVAMSLRWFSHQPFILPEHVTPPVWYGTKFVVVHMLPLFIRLCTGELLLLTMPLMLVFTPAMFRTRRTALVSGSILLVGLLASTYLYERHGVHKLARFCIPYLYNNIWYSGFEDFPSYLGHPPLFLTPAIRAAVSILLFLGGLALCCTVLLGPRKAEPAIKIVPAGQEPLDLRSICFLLLPCLAAYLMLLLPRHLGTGMVDRYLLFPEFVFLIFTSLLYQRNLNRQYSPVVWALIALMAILDTGGMHDTFALYRAQATLLGRLTASGVPRTAVDGGAQYNGWTELLVTGYVNDRRLRNPAWAYRPLPNVGADDPCRTLSLDLEPSIRAQYVVSFDPRACKGPSPFPPVTFSTFFGPHRRMLYAVLGPYAAK